MASSNTRHIMSALGVTCLVGMSSTALAQARFECSAKGGDFVFALEAKVPTYDQHVSTAAQSRNVASLMFESLMTRDEKMQPVLSLADSMTESQNGLVYTFKLRQGVPFHNGKIMTSDDVMASYERLVYGPLGLEGLVGIAFGGSPDAFQLLHLEGRVNYWFGKLAESGIRAVVHVGGGRGEFDSVTDVQVFDYPTGTPAPQIPGATEAGSAVAYGRFGTTFVGGGAGVMAAFSRQFGIQADVQVLATFPASALVIQPSFGASYGF